MKKLTKSILLIALLMLISGCSSITKNFTSNKHIKINENLPMISSNSIRTISDIQSIALEWKGLSVDNIYGYNIFRSNLQEDGQKLTKIASIKNKYASHFVDTNLKAQTQYLYSISVIGADNTQSNPSKPIKATTLNNLEPIAFAVAISNLPRTIKILWRPHSNKSVKYYIIQRNDEKKQRWESIAQVQNRLNAEYIDTKLKDNLHYAYRIISVTFNGIKSEPSKIVTAKTKPLPNSTSTIKATTSLARKIIVTWQPLDKDEIIGYNIYSSRSKNGYYTNIAHAKKYDNTYENILNENNKIRYYKITAIDKDGLETSKDSLPIVMGKTLEIPKTPNITLGLIKDQTVIINWTKGDNRAIYYNIHKTISEGMFKSRTKIYKNIQGTRFEDKDIVRGVDYEYELEAVDENGLLSKKTTPITLSMPLINKKTNK